MHELSIENVSVLMMRTNVNGKRNAHHDMMSIIVKSRAIETRRKIIDELKSHIGGLAKHSQK